MRRLDGLTFRRDARSAYARNRRAELSDRILQATERTLELLEGCALPRERQYLSQALRNHTAAYADLTGNDAKASPDVEHAKGILVEFRQAARIVAESNLMGPPRPGLIQD